MQPSTISRASTDSDAGRSLLSERDKRDSFREICRTLGILIKPKPRLNVWQWADRYRYVAKGASHKSLEGATLYRSADAPHQRKPQESATDPNVQVTVLVGASQCFGKTEVILNIAGYHMHHAPRSMIFMYPTLESAEKFSKKKFAPMTDATPELSKLLRPARSRDSGNTILTKEFSGGSAFFVGANSTPSLRGASGAVLLGDEIDSNEQEAGQEGDPVELLFKRGESFSSCVKVLASTPTILNASPIWSWFVLSDQQYWFVPCLKCGKYQTLEWSQVQWPKADGFHEPEKAFLVCSQCAAALNDRQRVEMYFNGEWRATAPFKGIAGFHMNGIYAPWPHQKGFTSRLHQMASDFLRAQKGGKLKQKVWVNTFLTMPWEDEAAKVEAAPLMKRTEDEDYSPQSLPNEIIIATAGIDVQKRFIQVEIVGHGLEEETWGIETRQIPGDPEHGDVWQDLTDLLSSKYTRKDGTIIPITATAIDMRHKPERVRNFVKTCGLPRVYPVYGVAGGQTILVTERFNKRTRMRTYAVDGKMAKDVIFARLQVEDKGPRYCHFPKGQGYNEKYFQQITAEVLKTEFYRGFSKQFYEKKPGAANEALDIRVYTLACIDILNPAMLRIAKRLKTAEGVKPSAPATGPRVIEPTTSRDYPLNTPAAPVTQVQPAQPQRAPRRRIRVGGWRGF